MELSGLPALLYFPVMAARLALPKMEGMVRIQRAAAVQLKQGRSQARAAMGD
jgi:hypothetical protein